MSDTWVHLGGHAGPRDGVSFVYLLLPDERRDIWGFHDIGVVVRWCT